MGVPAISQRLARERRTILAMIQLYCRAQHGGQAALCPDCQALADYALQRVERCPFKAGKPTCAKCLVHCYKPEMREKIRTVMRYAGPRMLLHHPGLAAQHLIDGVRYRPRPLKPARAPENPEN
jgi:hypothetical protein